MERLDKEITKTWLTGKHAVTMVIRKEIAAHYGLLEPSHVVLEPRPEGILIRKLEI